jgi:hypothetical protein
MMPGEGFIQQKFGQVCDTFQIKQEVALSNAFLTASGIGLAAALGLVAKGFGSGWRHVQRMPAIARHKVQKRSRVLVEPFQLKPRSSHTQLYTRDEALVDLIAESLVTRTSGVMVFSAPSGLGKSTFSRQVVRDLQSEQSIAGALFIDCEDITQLMDAENIKVPYAALRHHILDICGVPRDTKIPLPISSLFAPTMRTSAVDERRFIIVLDQFELFSSVCEERYLKNMIKGMALDAAQANVHNILVNVADDAEGLAKRMCGWNGNQKILPLLS